MVKKSKKRREKMRKERGLVNTCTEDEDRVLWYGACYYGQIDTLKWLVNQSKACWDEEICAFAAKGEHEDILKWVIDNGCPCELTCNIAAAYGDLNMLKFARKNGLPWSINTSRSALIRGHFDVLEWAVENGCPSDGEIDSFLLDGKKSKKRKLN